MGASYWDAQCLVVYLTFKETKFCSVYAVLVKFSWFEFASPISRTKWCKQLTQASTDCIERKFALFPHFTSRKRSTRMQIKQEAPCYCMLLYGPTKRVRCCRVLRYFFCYQSQMGETELLLTVKANSYAGLVSDPIWCLRISFLPSTCFPSWSARI